MNELSTLYIGSDGILYLNVGQFRAEIIGVMSINGELSFSLFIDPNKKIDNQ